MASCQRPVVQSSAEITAASAPSTIRRRSVVRVSSPSSRHWSTGVDDSTAKVISARRRPAILHIRRTLISNAGNPPRAGKGYEASACSGIASAVASAGTAPIVGSTGGVGDGRYTTRRRALKVSMVNQIAEPTSSVSAPAMTRLSSTQPATTAPRCTAHALAYETAALNALRPQRQSVGKRSEMPHRDSAFSTSR